MSEERYIKETHFRDMRGNLLFSEPMIFKRLYAVGQDLVQDSTQYWVRRVALADGVQHVNVERGESWKE